jgi:HAD superfamily hydrolase (TIGR01509 family)
MLKIEGGLELLALDWNGTTCDDQALAFGAVCACFRKAKCKLPPKAEFYDGITAAGYVQHYHSFGLPKSWTGERINAVRQVHMAKHWNDATLREGARELIEFCRQELEIPVIIVSGEHEAILARRLESFGIRDLFDEVHAHTRDKVGVFQQVFQRFGIKPSRAAYFDDSIDGIGAAQEVGMQTFGLTCGYTKPERIITANPTHVVGSFMEVHEGLRTMYRAA